MNGGKLSEVNARTESRRQNELVGKFKIAASDLVSIRGQVMEYTNIPTGIKIIHFFTLFTINFVKSVHWTDKKIFRNENKRTFWESWVEPYR